MRRHRSSDDQADEVDIDDRRKAEGAIRESEYKLRQIIDTVPSLVWATGLNGENTYASQRILDYIGAPYEDFENSGWQQFVHPDDLPETLKAFHHAIETGTSYGIVHRVRRADGEFRWHRTRGEPMRDRDGRIIQWYGLTIDVDEAKKAKDALRRDEAWLAQAQRLSHTGTWVMNGSTLRYLYWSDECYRIWGFDPLRGLPSREDMWGRIHPDDRERLRGEVQEALREQRDFFEAFKILLPDGTVKYLEANVHHEFSPLGALLEAICTTVDVTERKRAQDEREKLRQLESDLCHMNRVNMMGELAASLSHEVKQPIATARNNARAALNFLDKQAPDLGEVREALGCIVGDADRAGEIIDHIRDQLKKAPPKKDHFDLNAAINEVTVLARNAIMENGVSVQSQLAEALFPIYGDRVQLQQVVMNLLLNAVEAMGGGQAGARELLISTEQDHNGVLVALRDSGPGIDAAHLERVFDRFYTTKSKGMGMGLSICRSIIETHGGRLWATACQPHGTLFQFTIPARRA
jgi:PAS domain S-box-containing protein